MSAAGSAAATGIIRHLRQLGHQVIGMDADALAAPLAQDECDEFVLAPLAQHPDYPAFLTQLLPSFDLFIPFIDEELRVLASGRIAPSVLAKTLLCPASTLELCTSKIRLQEFCEQHGLPIAPLTTQVPAIFKPEFGRGGRGIHRLDTTAQLSCAQQQSGVIQTLLQGTEYTVDVLVDETGRWLFGLPRKRLQTAGVSRIGEVEQHPTVLALAKRCVAQIPFAYGINIQIMLDQSGQAHLIEINPRLAGSAIFSVAAGFDIFDLVIKLYTRQEFSLPGTENIVKLRSIRYWQEKHYVIS